jgi:ABC-type transporter Mla subunit MlaD
MAQKEEKLDEKLVEVLRENQTKANNAIVSLGEVSIRIRDLEKEVERVEEIEQTLLKEYDQATGTINAELQNLQKTYPSGEVDLTRGVVIYNVAE